MRPMLMHIRGTSDPLKPTIFQLPSRLPRAGVSSHETKYWRRQNSFAPFHAHRIHACNWQPALAIAVSLKITERIIGPGTEYTMKRPAAIFQTSSAGKSPQVHL